MPAIRRIQQITSSHCGPAVVCMLLDAIGIQVDQETVAKAADAEYSIEADGLRVDQIATAVARIAPEATFWYKYQATLNDIRYILRRGYGVGVEWQGLFYDTEEEEEEDDEVLDIGHYSIISDIDEAHQGLQIVNPHQDFAYHDRLFSIPLFLRRWWDTNEMVNPFSGKKELVEDLRLLFFITPKDQYFSPEMGFRSR
ncbi:MAG: hypothetical protein ABI425_02225 [Patescibacteria group bacterium]